MRKRSSVAVLAAALLAGGATAAMAQSVDSGNPADQDDPRQFNQDPNLNPNRARGQNLVSSGSVERRNDVNSGLNQPGVRREWIPGPLSPAAEREPDNPSLYNRTWPAGPLYPAAADNRTNQDPSAAQGASNQRRFLREQLRQAGFQNIRILNTAYLVQARTPDGRAVLMVIDPPPMAALQASGPTDQRSQPFANAGRNDGSDRSQQFGMNRNMGPTVDLRELSRRMEEPGLMEPEQVRSHLQSRGFSGISGLRRDGNVYTATANWFGEPVDVQVDGRNGFVIEPSHLTPAQVRVMLGGLGWDSINSIDLRDNDYRVQALRNGTPYALWIDARTGEINRQTASNQQ